MKIKLYTVGELQQSHLKEGTLLFEKRLKHYIPFEAEVIKPVKPGAKANQLLVAEKEGELLLSKTGSDFLVVLDETGKTLSSAGLASFLQKMMNQSVKTVSFAIGGAYGHSDAVRKKADLVLSLSPMTFTHEMARFFFTEQLYRAMTIIKGENYHH